MSLSKIGMYCNREKRKESIASMIWPQYKCKCSVSLLWSCKSFRLHLSIYICSVFLSEDWLLRVFPFCFPEFILDHSLC